MSAIAPGGDVRQKSRSLKLAVWFLGSTEVERDGLVVDRTAFAEEWTFAVPVWLAGFRKPHHSLAVARDPHTAEAERRWQA